MKRWLLAILSALTLVLCAGMLTVECSSWGTRRVYPAMDQVAVVELPWRAAITGASIPSLFGVVVFHMWWAYSTAVRSDRRRSRIENDECPNCGYDLRATTHQCPECGVEKKARGDNSLNR